LKASLFSNDLKTSTSTHSLETTFFIFEIMNFLCFKKSDAGNTESGQKNEGCEQTAYSSWQIRYQHIQKKLAQIFEIQ
jgi:hypothetical protein